MLCATQTFSEGRRLLGSYPNETKPKHNDNKENSIWDDTTFEIVFFLAGLAFGLIFFFLYKCFNPMIQRLRLQRVFRAMQWVHNSHYADRSPAESHVEHGSSRSSSDSFKTASEMQTPATIRNQDERRSSQIPVSVKRQKKKLQRTQSDSGLMKGYDLRSGTSGSPSSYPTSPVRSSSRRTPSESESSPPFGNYHTACTKKYI